MLLDLLRRDGQVVAKDVSRQLGLSEDTIRRDLRALAADGALQRVHGGALPSSPAQAGYVERQAVARDGKMAVGRAAASLVRSGQVVFVDGGTTAVQFARHLPPDLCLTVVTHSPSVAVELAQNPSVTVDLLGGRLFKHSVVALGATVAEGVGRVRADVFVMSVAGVHPDAGLTTGDAEEAAIKRLMCRAAATTVVLASHEKLGTAAAFLVVQLADAGTLVVEPDTSEDVVRPYRDMGVAVVRATAPPMS